MDFSLVSTAVAQTATTLTAPVGAAPTSGIMSQMVVLALIFGVFYFLLIRPQQKRMKKHQEMLSAIRRGDKIVTAGGILGTVKKVGDEAELEVEIANDVVVKIMKATVADVISKTEPANSDKPKSAKSA